MITTKTANRVRMRFPASTEAAYRIGSNWAIESEGESGSWRRREDPTERCSAFVHFFIVKRNPLKHKRKRREREREREPGCFVARQLLLNSLLFLRFVPGFVF